MSPYNPLPRKEMPFNVWRQRYVTYRNNSRFCLVIAETKYGYTLRYHAYPGKVYRTAKPVTHAYYVERFFDRNNLEIMAQNKLGWRDDVAMLIKSMRKQLRHVENQYGR